MVSFHGIKSTESVTKVVDYPSIWKVSSILTLEERLYNETEYNLEVFQRWLGSKLDEIYNPVAVIIESEEKKTLKKEQKSSNKSNLTKRRICISNIFIEQRF